MSTANSKVQRIVQIRFSFPSADPRQLKTMLDAARPYLKMFGSTSARLLQNVDDPSRFIQEIEYEANEAIETNRQRIASDPKLQMYLQAWRSLGATEIDVYRDVAV